ncbi:lipoyltransferase and lipoate-protein ligase [Limosilactobacillus frumenti DSM 13145]|uniref:lipoate--protein ligase n=2 Tax=Limosilactobacillus frumenti TaxID=104955 RepID=A0A0R1P3C3_9LACO|nr:lipoate--protein ligase [Limosilactobacillus frumenti]KRL27101.1 lipoyltransferase and lipoate-protein ligase [Limosilactobacillus frumenti DSM 13145]MBA2913789.1 lipoate--protein ligase [Limosilactobacillus frumenti]QFG72570.1 lipoate--protein ligase [Limosilactobacillus frumenti]
MIYLDLSNGHRYMKNFFVILALPDFLDACQRLSDDVLLYFYSPQTPVVNVGRYQNVYQEVNLPYLRQEGIQLVRRQPGGGAVYVDQGDLTYVYINTSKQVRSPHFESYAAPIIKTLRDMHVDVQQTGRNDLTVDGHKFSGMAFSKSGDRVTYGGTLMVDVNLDKASKAITPNITKLKDNGVKSVHSRITNLRPYLKGKYANLTLSELQEQILQNAIAEHGGQEHFRREELTTEEWQRLETIARDKYGSKQWIMGGNVHQYYFDHYYKGIGTVAISFDVHQHKITAAKLYGDFLMAINDLKPLEHYLIGCPLEKAALTSAFDNMDLRKNFADIDPRPLIDKMMTVGK